jgi:hypothetical protein
MTGVRSAKWFLPFLFCLFFAACAVGRWGAVNQVYETQETYDASKHEVWAAALKSLPRLDYLVQSMDIELGLIRTTSMISGDPEAFISGQRYRLEIIIEEISPNGTLVSIKPYFKRRFPDGPGGPKKSRELVLAEAEIFEHIRSYLSHKP